MPQRARKSRSRGEPAWRVLLPEWRRVSALRARARLLAQLASRHSSPNPSEQVRPRFPATLWLAPALGVAASRVAISKAHRPARARPKPLQRAFGAATAKDASAPEHRSRAC